MRLPSLSDRDLLVYCFVLQVVFARDCLLLSFSVSGHHIRRYRVTNFLFKADVVVCELAHFRVINAKDFSFFRCAKAETRNEVHDPYNDSLSLLLATNKSMKDEDAQLRQRSKQNQKLNQRVEFRAVPSVGPSSLRESRSNRQIQRR